MHSAVLQSKDYIKFADRYTVEVISLGSLEKGIASNDRRARTYRAKDGRECLVEFPNLTAEELIALNRSKASTYNDTGKVPFTAIVDPHTLEEMWRYKGGLSAKALMKAAKDAWKQLRQQYGEGLDRKTLRSVEEAITETERLAEKEEFARALDAVSKAGRKKGLPEAVRKRLEEAREQVVAKARERLREVERKAESDPAAAARDLSRLRSRMRGTGLEEDLSRLAERLRAGG